jgi:hypothetical protein
MTVGHEPMITHPRHRVELIQLGGRTDQEAADLSRP